MASAALPDMLRFPLPPSAQSAPGSVLWILLLPPFCSLLSPLEFWQLGPLRVPTAGGRDIAASVLANQVLGPRLQSSPPASFPLGITSLFQILLKRCVEEEFLQHSMVLFPKPHAEMYPLLNIHLHLA